RGARLPLAGLVHVHRCRHRSRARGGPTLDRVREPAGRAARRRPSSGAGRSVQAAAGRLEAQCEWPAPGAMAWSRPEAAACPSGSPWAMFDPPSSRRPAAAGGHVELRIRRALPADADRLSEIARTAKAHWGYPDAWLTAWAPILTITPEYAER